jgi:hypothetical protein
MMLARFCFLLKSIFPIYHQWVIRDLEVRSGTFVTAAAPKAEAQTRIFVQGAGTKAWTSPPFRW